MSLELLTCTQNIELYIVQTVNMDTKSKTEIKHFNQLLSVRFY